MADLCAAALWYARQGWRVFPLHTVLPDGSCSCGKPDCDDQGKHPRTPNGCLAATTDPGQIKAWWSRWPNANLGGATGALSGFVVLDIDPRHGGDDTLAAWEAEHGKLPETPQSLTGGGGFHYVFAHPGEQLRNRTNLLGAAGEVTGVDFRGDGGYIVLPPSTHKSGRAYAWEMSAQLSKVPVAPLPPALYEIVKQPYDRPFPQGEPGDLSIIEGGRNQALHKMACRWRADGMDPDFIYQALSKVNQERCRPPLEDREVRKVAMNGSRYQPNPIPEGKPSFQELRSLALKLRPEGYDSQGLDELLTHDFGDSEYLVDRLLVQGGTSLLVAKPGVGKSTMIRTLIRAVAGGRESILGRDVQQHGLVYYFALEERLDQVVKHFKQMGSDPWASNIRIFCGEPPEQALEKAYAEILRYQPVLVVFDPLIGITRTSDLNSYGGVREMMSLVMMMSRITKTHIACIHHAAKGARDDIDAGVGSVAFPGTVDTQLVMARKAGDIRVLRTSKVRYGEDLPETVLLLNEQREVVDGGTLEERQLDSLREKILELLSLEELTEPEINVRLGDHQRGLVARCLRALTETKQLVRAGNGRPGSPFKYQTPTDLTGSVWETLEIPSLWVAGEDLPPEGMGF